MRGKSVLKYLQFTFLFGCFNSSVSWAVGRIKAYKVEGVGRRNKIRGKNRGGGGGGGEGTPAI